MRLPGYWQEVDLPRNLTIEGPIGGMMRMLSRYYSSQGMLEITLAMVSWAMFLWGIIATIRDWI